MFRKLKFGILFVQKSEIIEKNMKTLVNIVVS